MAWGLGIGAGVGLLKNELIDKPQAAIDNKLKAEIDRYSPWTHKQSGPLETPNPFNAALQYGAAGALMSRGLKAPNTSTANTTLDSGLGQIASGPVTSNSLVMPQVGDSAMSSNPWSLLGK